MPVGTLAAIFEEKQRMSVLVSAKDTTPGGRRKTWQSYPITERAAIIVSNSEIIRSGVSWLLAADVEGPAYPSALPRLTNNEIARVGEYRIVRLILQPWDRWNGRRCCGRTSPH